ncbi:hypothetical protein TOPH_02639 [Tolypocladium ophioglossoides CBS 100239]|uniref:Uncharacterized protein n=1 Tax=Tolypocladium ophioglossoides (strain CBS 100239) TaxID=1163406 RepID=A0A0L0NED2_TOLOC|nr:hypothetical protein TOPH_02639 [Tolypocladium ophioglossoides CBS 100239]
MARPDEPRRRFAPVPIETTFQSVRNTTQHAQGHVGPNPELTPEPSPRSPSPTIPGPQQYRRRFKPQLIETSRRTRRAGDPGPATRPTDKTDITPYTNHIYLTKHKPRRKRGESVDDEPLRHMPPTRRETEDEGVKEYLLELAAKEAARQIEAAALAAFPNSRAREGGVAHFYFRESSDSDNSAENTPQDRGHGQSRVRRKSSNLDLNWWHKHMQKHAEHLAEERDDDEMEVDEEDTFMRTDSDLDKMDLAVPPNPLWTTTNKIAPDDRRDSMVEIQLLREPLTPITQLDRSIADDNRHTRQTHARAGHVPPTSGNQEPVLANSTAGHLAPDARHRAQDLGFGRPFGAFGLQPEDPKLHLIRQAASPPMLGKDLTFRKCPSPKQTKLETDHPFVEDGGSREKNRDVSGDGGLWRGYCCRSESNAGYIVPADLHGAHMIVTPQPPGTPREPLTFESLSEEPGSMYASSDSSGSPPGLWTVENRPKNGAVKGLHMLHGLDERLRREKAQAERDEKILQEFGDEFVTQVYNYLSLGYPAMAHSFDEELAKISRVSVEELGRDDEKQMAKGHMLEMKLEDSSEDARCPRWKALKVYIMEWARQRPDLDNLDPLAWGVRERRGSWAI